jgi:hypothetical protein
MEWAVGIICVGVLFWLLKPSQKGEMRDIESSLAIARADADKIRKQRDDHHRCCIELKRQLKELLEDYEKLRHGHSILDGRREIALEVIKFMNPPQFIGVEIHGPCLSP